MRSNEGNASDGARIDRTRHRPGSRPSRLGNASKQLDILMEDVDLDAEPELAEALTEAVLAVDRASEQVRGRDHVRGRPANTDIDDGAVHDEMTSGETDRSESVRAEPRAERREPRLAGGSRTE